MSIDHEANKRSYYRKSVTLAGNFANQRNDDFGEMLVEDLSLQGVRFVTLNPHQLRVGDRVVLSFRLDDAKRTEIRRKAEVRSVQDRHVGAQFLHNASMDKDLGFYLMS